MSLRGGNTLKEMWTRGERVTDITHSRTGLAPRLTSQVRGLIEATTRQALTPGVNLASGVPVEE